MSSPEVSHYDTWSSPHPLTQHASNYHRILRRELEELGPDADLLKKMEAVSRRTSAAAEKDEKHESNERKALKNGAKLFLTVTQAYEMHEAKKVKVEVDGVEMDVPIGPDLWRHFMPPPNYQLNNDLMSMTLDKQIESYLQLKRGSVYSNKSSYCKEKPCRQYYCPSCSNKLHSGPKQHTLLPAGKPERRPRKDKNMYLVH
ncbi:unnamed protein product [Caenorhabditis sp. 36 PRJEB53466]|nr:unnamed protein product [Caenorhabditis sp. 36 PRJEB53466]